ncbi:MAG: NAD(P)-dependent oxidoreductase [Solirubrobacteraceae bacterium]
MANERIGFIGLGIMGSRMAACAARAGFEVAVWNRTRERAETWVAEHGGSVADSPAALAAGSRILVTMLVDGPQVQAVLTGADVPAGVLCVDCSTIGAAAARTIGGALAERGVSFIDAPVTGSAPRAQDGTLTIMAGGEAADVERARPLLEAMGSLVLHVGGLGDGQTIKVINNALAAANTQAVAEALRVGAAAGIDLDSLVAVLESGSGGSTMLSLKQAPIRARSYEPLFKLEHMLKDVQLCLEAARTPFPAAESAAATLARAQARGMGELDFAALAEALDAGH